MIRRNVLKMMFSSVNICSVYSSFVTVECCYFRLFKGFLGKERQYPTATTQIKNIPNIFVAFHSFQGLTEVDQVLLVGGHPYFAFGVNGYPSQTIYFNTFFHVLLLGFLFKSLHVGFKKHVVFILFLDYTDESKFFSYFSINFTVHMKKLLRLFAVFEGFLKLFFDFAGYCFEFLALVDFRHLFW